MRHYFEFDGVKSSDFGVFISGAQTMGAAGRDVDEIVVPGRDGNLTIDNGRFNAVAHTYPAFIAEDAKEGLKGLRNALLSKRGHKRLSDTVHPDEFYRAYYEHGLEPELTANLRHSELEIEFTRDPRRFLVSGDTPQDVSVTTETLSGSSVSFDNETGADRITGLSVSIMAVQSGSGDPSPTNIRPITGWTGATVTRTGKNLLEPKVFTSGRGYTNPIKVDFSKYPSYTFSCNISTDICRTMFYGYSSKSDALGDVNKIARTAGTAENVRTISKDLFTYEVAGDVNSIEYIIVYFYGGNTTAQDLNNGEIQVEIGSSATAFEPYGASYPVTWSEAGTVYGGTLDVTRGKLRATWAKVSLTSSSSFASSNNAVYIQVNGLVKTNNYYGKIICDKLATYIRNSGSMPIYSITGYNDSNTSYPNDNWMYFRVAESMSQDVMKAWLNEVGGIDVIYELATPLEYDLTPTEIETLSGQNNVWADCGDVSVTLQLPSTLINPTLFPSSPKIRVHGQGTLYIGNTAITVGGCFPYVDIDTEIADCSYEGQNANQYVTFSGLDFPKLEPGENYITFTGFTAVEVTPRWWRL